MEEPIITSAGIELTDRGTPRKNIFAPRDGWMKYVFKAIEGLLNEGHRLNDITLDEVREKLDHKKHGRKPISKASWYWYRCIYHRTRWPRIQAKIGE